MPIKPLHFFKNERASAAYLHALFTVFRMTYEIWWVGCMIIYDRLFFFFVFLFLHFGMCCAIFRTKRCFHPWRTL